jgi:5-methylcytosine-specific restriction endonuclease McrA
MEGTEACSGVKSKTEMEFFISCVTEEEIKRERAKARELRKSQWWGRKCSEGRCYYCNKKSSPKELTMDHIVPIIRGGKSTKGNMVPSCKECNSKKKHMLPMEWEEYIRSFELFNP